MSNSIFELDEFKPLASRYQARKARATRYWRYYKAEVYESEGDNSITRYIQQRIANTIKPLFTPIARAVNVDVALIPGDWTLTDHTHDEAAATLLRWSNWDLYGDIWVRYVMAMGNGGLYVHPNPALEQVTLQPLRPDNYITVPTSRYDPTPRMAIMIGEGMDDEGKPVEEATVITPTRIHTFVGGEPVGLEGNGASYTNPLGFVPIIECLNDVGDGKGEPTFDDVIASLDQANTLASYLTSIIKKHAEPQWSIFGAEAGDMEKSGDSIWFFPEGSDVKAVLASVDFEGVMNFVKEVKEEVKESLPELAIAKLVGVERVAAATIELQLAEAVFKIRRLRKVIDLRLAQAMQLAGIIGESMGIGALNDERLAFDKARPVITVDALTNLQIQQAGQTVNMNTLALERERVILDGE